jgi:hypothetical protein
MIHTPKPEHPFEYVEAWLKTQVISGRSDAAKANHHHGMEYQFFEEDGKYTYEPIDEEGARVYEEHNQPPFLKDCLEIIQAAVLNVDVQSAFRIAGLICPSNLYNVSIEGATGNWQGGLQFCSMMSVMYIYLALIPRVCSEEEQEHVVEVISQLLMGAGHRMTSGVCYSCVLACGQLI